MVQALRHPVLAPHGSAYDVYTQSTNLCPTRTVPHPRHPQYLTHSNCRHLSSDNFLARDRKAVAALVQVQQERPSRSLVLSGERAGL